MTVQTIDEAEAAVQRAVAARDEAARRAARETEQACQERIAQLCAEIEQQAASADVDKAAQALGKALDTFCATVKVRSDRHLAIADELIRIGEVPLGTHVTSGRGDITIAGTVYQRPAAPETIARMAKVALRQYFPRERFNLDQGG